MANNKATRENKHSFRLNEEEDQLLKANVKKSRLGKSEYIRRNILYPCDKNEIKKDCMSSKKVDSLVVEGFAV